MATRRQQLERTSWFAVVRAYEACTRQYTRMLAHFELTVPQYDLLKAVQRLGPEAAPKNIAEALVVTRGNVTGPLHRLKSRGLLRTREHEADGRSFICELTATAIGLLTAADEAANAFISEQLAPFDDASLRGVGDMMLLMAEHLDMLEPDAIAEKVLYKRSTS